MCSNRRNYSHLLYDGEILSHVDRKTYILTILIRAWMDCLLSLGMVEVWVVTYLCPNDNFSHLDVFTTPCMGGLSHT